MSFPEKGREILLLSYTNALLESSKSLLLASMGHLGCHLECITAQESSTGWVQARHIWGPHGTLMLYMLSLRRLSLCDYCAGFFLTIHCLSVEMETSCLASRARAAFTLWHIPGCRGTFLRALSLRVLQIPVYISSDLCWTRWATLRFHQGV